MQKQKAHDKSTLFDPILPKISLLPVLSLIHHNLQSFQLYNPIFIIHICVSLCTENIRMKGFINSLSTDIYRGLWFFGLPEVLTLQFFSLISPQFKSSVTKFLTLGKHHIFKDTESLPQPPEPVTRVGASHYVTVIKQAIKHSECLMGQPVN